MDIVNDLIRRRAACEQEIAEQDRKIQEYEMPYSTALSGGLTENSERIRGKDRRGGIYRAGCDDTAETCGVQTEDTEL